ncbi:MAG: hypothetical protein KQJ78_14840 [Deltaproteobacteria bacterium]|nr:hypothetical protein [Deltaproteobacteria bacterium]
MDITSVTITPEGNYLVALADGRLLAVPDDPANADRQTVAAWEAAGGVIGESVVDLEARRAERQGELLAVVNRFIEAKPDGRTRYDTNLKLNVIMAGVNAMAAGQAKPAAVAAVEAWIAAVQAEYFSLKAALAAAATPEELDAVDLTCGRLEGLYGVAGSQAPDPDVTTADLVGQ